MTQPRQLARLGRLRWLMWGLGAVVYFGIIFERMAASAVADRLMAEFGIAASSLGALAALQLFTYTVMQVPAGALADTLGPRRVLGAGALLAGLGTLLFSLAPAFGWAVVGRVLVGLGDSLVFLNVLRLQAEWFRPREYATLAGLSAFAAGLGGLCATAVLALLVEAFGWRPTLATSGLALLGVAVLAWLLLRDRPAELGLPAYHELDGTAAPSRRPRLRQEWRRVATNPATGWAALSHLALFAPYLAMTTVWGVPYLMQVYGLSRPAAGALLSLAPLSYFLSGPLAGFLSDRLGRRRAPMLAVEALLVLVGLGLASPQPLPLPLVAGLLAGLGAGAGTCLLAFAAAKEANPPALSGLTTGFVNVGGCGGGALLQLLIGYLLDLRWSGQQIEGARLYGPEAYAVAFLALLGAVLLGIYGTLRLRA